MEANSVIDSSFDAIPLASKDEYAIYYNLLLFYLDSLLNSRKELCLSDQETDLIGAYLQYVISTVRALRLRYLYDPEHSVKLDVDDSGFPTYLELRGMYNELVAKNQIQKPLMTVEQLKKKAEN